MTVFEKLLVDARWCGDVCVMEIVFFFSSRRRHTRCLSDWSSDVCSSDIRGLQGSANFILALGKQSTVFGPERGVAAGGAEALEAVVERGCGAPGGRRRIVQFVGQTGRQFAKRGQFFALLLVARDVANAI